MPLIKELLKTNLQTFVDEVSTLFINFPSSIEENAEKWSNSINNYAQSIIPPSTTTSLAKEAMLNIMKGLSEPINEQPFAFPFTIYYKSPEKRLFLFNRYLTEVVKYKSNPSLDKSSVFTILNKIRETYNLLYPMVALTVDDIYYNQKRFNQIYAEDILNKRKFKLLPDGVTIDTGGVNSRFYSKIPVNSEGIIVPLQEDGIIGDDTIRYSPIISFSIYEKFGDKKFNEIYSDIEFITQPSDSGEVSIYIPTKNKKGDYEVIRKSISANTFQNNYINKKKSKDYTKLIIEKTQSDLDGNFLLPAIKLNDLISVFEKNHSTCDKFWLKNNIKTLSQLKVFLNKKKVEFDLKPNIEKDGIMSLEQGVMAYAQQLAIGMSPTFTAAPSVTPLSLSQLSSKGLAGATADSQLDLMIDLIHIYLKSGIATNNSSGVTTSWQ